jgi:hypothetical protein
VPAWLDRLARDLPMGWGPVTGPADLWYALRAIDHGTDRCSLLLGDQPIFENVGVDSALAALESRLHFDAASLSPSRLFVHAGVVGWRDRAIVLPGRSRSGKTTLVAALLDAGATYLSDEYAILDERGLVHPYPKPLSIRIRGSRWPRRVTAGELGARTSEDPLRVGLVAAATYRPGERWQPRELSSADALLVMLQNTVVARSRPAFALDVLAATAAGVSALRGCHADAASTAGSLLDHLDRAI